MEPFIVINPDHPGNYYALFYLLSFLTGFVVLMWEGHKRKFPTIPWMMVIATAFLFFMAGCRLIAFSKEEWSYVFRFEPIPYSTARSVLGGILLSVPGILLAKKCLRFQYNMMDAFAVVLPLALVVQRFGCLMASCCYGTPAHLPWAIQYGSNSHAFSQHVQEGLISAESAVALPVHPVQLYEVLCCIVIIILLIKLHRVIKASGNLFLTSVGLYGVFRFLLEFVRASGGHSVGGEYAFHLNYAQWCILLVVPLLFLFILHREKKFCPDMSVVPAVCNEFFRPAGYFLLLATLFLFVSRWLDRLEIVSFNICLLPMLAMLTWYLFTWATVPRYRLATAALPLGALLLMSQTLPELTKKDSTRSSYNTFSLGFMGGNTDLIYGDDYSGDCLDNGQRTSYSNSYSAFAVGFAHTRQRGDRSTTFGLNWFKGQHDEYASSSIVNNFPGENHHFSTFAFNPYVQFNRTKHGLGFGLNVGEFTRIVPVKNGDASTVKQYNFYPSFRFRVGDLTKGFFEYKFADQFPTSFPALNHQLSVGFGTRKKDGVWRGGGIRFGTASNAGLFVSTSSAIGEHVILETFLGGFGGLFNPYDHAHSSMGSISLKCKFSKKEKLP